MRRFLPLLLASSIVAVLPACFPPANGGSGGGGGINRLDRDGDDADDDDELADPDFVDGDGTGVEPTPMRDGGAGGGDDRRPTPPPPATPPPATPPPATPPPPPPPSAPDAGPSDPGGGSDLTAEERDLMDAINAERATRGLAPVAVDDRLQCAARKHARDVGASGDCGHVGSDGTWPWDRAMACGFPQETWTVNEIAAGPGFTDGADAVWGWSHSEGHYAALMHERAAFGGFAVYDSCFIAVFDCCVAGSE